jgi:hypothetical protein
LKTLQLLISSFIIFFLGFSSLAQPSILEKFSAEHISGKVFLSWTVKSGQTCNGIRIYRSEDSLSYTEIGDIQGVCGNLGYSVNYTFQDNDPTKNKVNFYRLDLGGIELTYSIAVEVIDVGQNDYYLKANPLVDQTKLYFRNPSQQTTVLTVISQNGKIIETKETTTDYFTLNSNDYLSGLYFFTLSNPNADKNISGKFMVTKIL